MPHRARLSRRERRTQIARVGDGIVPKDGFFVGEWEGLFCGLVEGASDGAIEEVV